MADVDSYSFTTTKVRKTKKVTSSKRRESNDGGADVTITEITEKENHIPSLTNGISRKQRYLLAFIKKLSFSRFKIKNVQFNVG